MQRRLIIITLLFLVCVLSQAAEKKVTLKEKIGQMLMIGFEGSELHFNDAIVQSILKQQIGGVVLFDYDFKTQTNDRNIKDPQQLKKLTKQLQTFAYQAAAVHKNNLYPLFISLDYEGGKVNRLKESYGFPHTLSAAEVGQESQQAARKLAKKMANTLQQAGINFNYAPVVDVNVNADNPVIGKMGRSFSKDPIIVNQYAAIFSKAYAEKGIICVYKHFPGHGSSIGDTHQGLVDITHTWKKYELEPYKELFKLDYSCPAVMTAHVVHKGLDNAGYPASISKPIITHLLREKLGFKGVVVTDDLQMKAIADHYGTEQVVRQAINAGADILLFGNQLVTIPQDPQLIIDMIYADVQSGKISQSRINAAYQRIMQLKSSLRAKQTY